MHKPFLVNMLLFTVTLVCVALILVAAEYVAMRNIVGKGVEPEPFVLRLPRPLPTTQAHWGQFVLSYVDPHLGYAASPTRNPLLEPGKNYVRYGRENAALTIVALGGSTTDAYTAAVLEMSDVDPTDPYNWPRDLYRLMSSEGIDASVINAGTLGYNSSQDLLKLLRDMLPLRPDIVIALEGVNDLGFIFSVENHPYVAKYQKKLLDAITADRQTLMIMPNLVRLVSSTLYSGVRTVEGYTLGVPDETTPAKHWHRNMRAANALCEEFGVEYLCILQPLQGYGVYSPSERERHQLELKTSTASQYMGHDYMTALISFYEEAHDICAANPMCADFTDIFSQAQEVYFDATHLNERGTQILAQRVFSELLRRDLVTIP